MGRSHLCADDMIASGSQHTCEWRVTQVTCLFDVVHKIINNMERKWVKLQAQSHYSSNLVRYHKAQRNPQFSSKYFVQKIPGQTDDRIVWMDGQLNAERKWLSAA